MPDFNRIIMAGHLTRDPQLMYTPSNTAVCKFGIAVGRKWKDRDGNQKEETCFVDCTAFGKTAETINQYLSKGRAVLVEGRLSYQQWTDKEGKNRSKHEIAVESFQFLGSGGASRGRAEAGDTAGGELPPVTGDDIPF